MFLGFEDEVAEVFRLLGIAGLEHLDNAVGAGELGHYESTAALGADETAEDGVCDTDHGGQHRGWGNKSRAN